MNTSEPFNIRVTQSFTNPEPVQGGAPPVTPPEPAPSKFPVGILVVGLLVGGILALIMTKT